jgi:hypothetical protein
MGVCSHVKRGYLKRLMDSMRQILCLGGGFHVEEQLFDNLKLIIILSSIQE